MEFLTIATVAEDASWLLYPSVFLKPFFVVYVLMVAVLWLTFLNKFCWKFWASVASRLARKLPKALRMQVEFNLTGRRARHHHLRFVLIGLPAMYCMALICYSVLFYFGPWDAMYGMIIGFVLSLIYLSPPFQEFLLKKGYTRLVFDLEQTLAVQAARQAAD